ncbi:MAG: hypothetical protein AB1632_13080 [Nitrospirota bacterium]
MPKQEEIAQKILTYLASCPEGEDTIEGITNWWLKLNKGRHAQDEIKYALDLLLERGELEETRARKDIFIYRVKKGQKV